MSTQTLTGANFEATITGNDIVLVDFWAAWCGPCRQFAPVFEAASEQNPDIVFGKVDTEAEQALAAAANITSIPTLMAFKEGVLVFAQPGALPQSALTDVIRQVKDLDMAPIEAQHLPNVHHAHSVGAMAQVIDAVNVSFLRSRFR